MSRANRKTTASQPASVSANGLSTGTVQQDGVLESDLRMLSVEGLFKKISERISDPVTLQMLNILSEKVSKEFSDHAEAEKRGRTIVVSGLQEPADSLSASERRADLKAKVLDVLDALQLDCEPVETYRIGKHDASRPRMVKVVLPSQYYWRRALANARTLRSAGLAGIFVRRSMTADERKREFELRQLANERNRGKARREWVVYRSQLKHISELPNLPNAGSGKA